jgi:hypothetical protein
VFDAMCLGACLDYRDGQAKRRLAGRDLAFFHDFHRTNSRDSAGPFTGFDPVGFAIFATLPKGLVLVCANAPNRMLMAPRNGFIFRVLAC